jgi:cell fate regulator YaaT (PSP1 superfamily)
MANEHNEFIEDDFNEIDNARKSHCQGNCRPHTIDGKLYSVKIGYSSEIELAVSKEEYKKNDFLIASTRYGADIVEVLGEVKSKCCGQEPIPIIRKAESRDFTKEEENRYKAKEAFRTAKEKIKQHKLEMKLIATHYLLEEPKILFLFTADQRIDFRELVKDLVATFHVRIELRQIGVRDETRTIGGLAICGRDYCCHSISDKLRPVSIKMVKDQNLSLNSIKISGSCGRLLCCLAYEHDFYASQKKKFPADNTRIMIDNEIWRVSEVNIISQKITLTAEDGRSASYPIANFSRNPDQTWSFIVKK